MKQLPLILLIIYGSSMALVNASIMVEVEPDVVYDQLWAYESYSMNFSIHDLNLTDTTDIVFNGEVKWRGIGQYHHGKSVSGYSYNLDNIPFTDTGNTSHPYMILNLNLPRDYFLFGMKPYETIQITVTLDAIVETVDTNGGENTTITSFNHIYNLIDDEKVTYLEHKMEEMNEELTLATSTLGVEGFNRSKYMSILMEMNQSLQQGNYEESLDLWSSWDNRDRMRMFSNLINHVNQSQAEYESLKPLEGEYEVLQTEYEALEGKYIALLNSNRNTIEELNHAKTGLSTAITGVFVSAILFFFLGRSTYGRVV